MYSSFPYTYNIFVWILLIIIVIAMVENVASAEVISEETQNNKWQLNLFYNEAELSDKSNLSEEKQKVVNQIEELFGIDCSSAILPWLRELTQKDVDKLEYMGNQWLTITRENIFSLLSADLTDDEIKKLVEFQKMWWEIINRDVLFQLVSPMMDRGNMKAMKVMIEEIAGKTLFCNYLSENPEDAWLLSNMDSLLKIYPLWKIKGLYFYRKIDDHNISSMREVDYYLGWDGWELQIREEYLSLFSGLTVKERKIIKQILDLFSINIYPEIEKELNNLVCWLAGLSQENVDTLRSRKEYIQKLFGWWDDRENLINSSEFLPLASITQEKWDVIDNAIEVIKVEPSPEFLPSLAKLSQEDVNKLKHFKELWFEINEENILWLASLELNEDESEIEYLLELQKNWIDMTADVTDRLDEYVKVWKFISELWNEEPDIWIKSHVNKLLKIERRWHKYWLYEVKGVYYFHRFWNVSYRDFYEYVSAYETIYNNTDVLEFVYKMWLEKEFNSVTFYELVKEIPLEILKFIQENMGHCSYGEVSRMSYLFNDRHHSVYSHKNPRGRMEYYNFDLEKDGERIDCVLQVIRKFYLEKGIEVTFDTLFRLLKFVLILNINWPLLSQYFESWEITTDDMEKICDILGKFEK